MEIYTGEGQPQQDLCMVEDPANEWQSNSSFRDEQFEPSSWEEGSQPLEVSNVASPSLSVYVVRAGPPDALFPSDAASFVIVRAIMDMNPIISQRTRPSSRTLKFSLSK